jgi:hypothetical protein
VLLVVVGAWTQAALTIAVADTKRVGILSPFSPAEDGIEAFRESLRKLGWIDGQNVDIKYNGQTENLNDFPIWRCG